MKHASSVSVTLTFPTLHVITEKAPDNHTIREWKQTLAKHIIDQIYAVSDDADGSIPVSKLITNYNVNSTQKVE